MKEVIRKSLLMLKVLFSGLREMYFYCYYSTTFRSEYDQDSYLARIIAHYHVVEKGLAMPERKKLFGVTIVKRLLRLIKEYKEKGYDQNNSQYIAAVGALCMYYEVIRGKYLKDVFKENEYKELLLMRKNGIGGVKKIKKSEMSISQAGDYHEFINSRVSIRNFTKKDVPEEIIQQAVEIAGKSPSSCNRQPNRVYIIKKKEKIDEVLSIQVGNRGFGHLVNSLVIITSDLKIYHGFDERHLPFVDGGMFSLGLLYALHYKHIGACILNWATNESSDRKLRNVIDIHPSEKVVVIIAAGYYDNEFLVPYSHRRNVSEVIRTVIK